MFCVNFLFQCCAESDDKNFLKNKAAQVFSLIFVCDYPEKVSYC